MLAEQRGGKIKRPLRSFVPVSAEVEAVDHDKALGKSRRVHETVAVSLCLEGPAKNCGAAFGLERKIGFREIIHRQGVHVPTEQRLEAQAHFTDTLPVVLHLRAVINPAHCVDEDFYFHFAVESGHGHLKTVVVTLAERAMYTAARAVVFFDELPVYPDINYVVRPLDSEIMRTVFAFYCRGVKYVTRVLSEIFHTFGSGAAVLLSQHIKVFPKVCALRKSHFSYAPEHGTRRQRRGVVLALRGKQNFPDPVICGRVIAVFVEQRGVVVTGDRRQVFREAVCSRREAEVGSAVESVHVHIHVVLHHFLNLSRDGSRIAGVMTLAPMVEPTAPEFHTGLGHIGLSVRKTSERARGTRPEIERGIDVGQRSARKHILTSPVRSEKRHVDSVSAHTFLQGFEIILVVAVGAVFVLNLHCDDVAAFGYLQRNEFRHSASEIIAHLFHIHGVVAAHPQIFVAEQPGGKTSEIPLRANVRTRAYYHVKPEFLRRPAITRHIVHSFKAEFAFPRLVNVPAHNRLHGVEPRGFQFFQSVPPVLRQHPEIVHRPRIEPERFSVEK